MSSYGQTAAKVRAAKEKRPEYYCDDSRCLFRVVVFDGHNQPQFKQCTKHPHLNKNKRAQVENNKEIK